MDKFENVKVGDRVHLTTGENEAIAPPLPTVDGLYRPEGFADDAEWPLLRRRGRWFQVATADVLTDDEMKTLPPLVKLAAEEA